MACLLVPAAEAVVTTIVRKAIEKKEKKAVTIEGSGAEHLTEDTERIPFSRKLKWLTNLLWGGAILLAFEHVWHGEIVPFFPFLTRAADPASAAEMLREMATVGVTMAVLVTLIWVGMLAVVSLFEKRARAEHSAEEANS